MFSYLDDKKKQELLKKLGEPPLNDKTPLINLLASYYLASSLGGGDHEETNLVEMVIDTRDSNPTEKKTTPCMDAIHSWK